MLLFLNANIPITLTDHISYLLNLFLSLVGNFFLVLSPVSNIFRFLWLAHLDPR